MNKEKEFLLDLIKLLTAIEAWACKQSMPDYIFDQITPTIEQL